MSRKLPDIQILRAFACIAVLFSHIDFLSNIRPSILLGCERQGVYLFFAISGFIISKAIDDLGMIRDRNSGCFMTRLKENINLLKVYLIRRFFRIFPVALLNLGLIFFVSITFKNILDPMVVPSEMLRFLLSFGTLGVDVLRWSARVYGEAVFIDYGYWSLSGEEKAYLLFSFCCIFMKNTKQLIKFFVVWIFVSYFIHMFLSFFIQSKSGLLELYYHSPFITISQFFVGSIAYFFYKNFKIDFLINRSKYILSLLSLLIFTFSAFQVYSNSVLAYVVSLFLSPLIVYLSSTQEGLFPKWLLRDVLIKIGDRSYVLYLVHAPIFYTINVFQELNWFPQDSYGLTKGAIFIGSLAIVTEIIHKTFEQPLIKYGRKKSNFFIKNPSQNLAMKPVFA